MDVTYAEIGAEVVIGFGSKFRYSLSMIGFRGTKTIVTHVYRFPYGVWCGVAHNGFSWPVEDMILASDIDLLTPEQRVRIK